MGMYSPCYHPSQAVEMIEERYKRQCVLPDFGLAEQTRLKSKHVVIIGLGGLGSTAATVLEAMGIGKITAFDGDVVEESNLHRQFIYNIHDLGIPKAAAAEKYFTVRRPGNQFCFLSKDFSEEDTAMLTEADLVLDGSDRFQTRYLMDAVCATLCKPLLSVSVFRYEIQMVLLHVSNSQDKKAVGLQHLFGDIGAGQQQNCSEAGILGATAGIAGNMMALEAVKYLCMPEKALQNEICHFNTLNFESTRIAYGT